MVDSGAVRALLDPEWSAEQAREVLFERSTITSEQENFELTSEEMAARRAGPATIGGPPQMPQASPAREAIRGLCGVPSGMGSTMPRLEDRRVGGTTMDLLVVGRRPTGTPFSLRPS